MAKKNLASLVSGLMGTDNSGETDTIKTSANPDVGRNRKTDNAEMMVTSLRINKKTLRKLKMIAAADDKKFQDVVASSFDMFISKWEEENGKVPLSDN